MMMMNLVPVGYRGDFSPIPAPPQCSSCYKYKYNLRSLPYITTTTRFYKPRKRGYACQATMETEPESNDNKEVLEDGTSPSSVNGLVEETGHLDSTSISNQSKDEPVVTESSKLKSSLERIDGVLGTPNSIQNKDEPVATESSKLKSSLERIDGVLGTPNSIQNKDEPVATESSKLKSSLEKIDGVLGTQNSIQNKVEPANSESSDLKDSLDKIAGMLNTPDSIQGKEEEIEVSSGSPLPGMKQLGEPIMIPKATIDILKDQVFGFDTFFVTSQEPYEQGVLFKGNLRGKAATSFEKITKRLKDSFGDQYRVFLLINPEDDKPVAVIVPKQTLQPQLTAVPEWFAAAAFGLVTVFTLLLRNVPALQSNLLSSLDNLELLKDGLPGALVTAMVLGIHEIGHILVARDIGAKLGVPYFVPSWQIGSFGAITRISSIITNRKDLLKLAAAGPLAGFSLGFMLLLLGFILPPSDGIGLVVDPAVFHESFLVGGIAKLILGDALREGTPLSVNPLVIWSWAGLLINAINSIPAGELDGGRISFALWGRKASSRLSSVAIALLGISSLFNDMAFYWVVLIFFLQRGPVAPLSEEITEPENEYIALGVAVLLFGLLICLPYPFSFTQVASLDF